VYEQRIKELEVLIGTSFNISISRVFAGSKRCGKWSAAGATKHGGGGEEEVNDA
jgi:hypothetical protein